MNEWISVKDKLPTSEVDVLIACKNGSIIIEKISIPKDGNLWNCTEKEFVTHWMPLPKLPEVEVVDEQ